MRHIEGPAGALTLLLLHGWTVSADVNWFRCYQPLSERYSVVAMDHRGHGRGIRSIKPFRLEDCADDAAALVRHLGCGPVVAVGYSMGGPIAQLLWRRHPEVVDGIVLCATSRTFASRRPGTRALFAGMLGLSAAARVTPAALRRQVFEAFVSRRVGPATPLSEWVVEEARRNDPAAVLQAGYASAGSRRRSGSARSTCPPRSSSPRGTSWWDRSTSTSWPPRSRAQPSTPSRQTTVPASPTPAASCPRCWQLASRWRRVRPGSSGPGGSGHTTRRPSPTSTPPSPSTAR